MTVKETRSRFPNLTRAPKEAIDEEEVEALRSLFTEKWITYTELKKLEETTGKTFKRGRFTKTETDICMAAVEAYIQSKGIDRQEFIEMMFVKNNEKSLVRSRNCSDFFVQVAGKLEGRPVVNVYHFLRRRLHPNNKGESWNPELDEELKRLYMLHGPQWEVIGKELDRFHIACRDRYRKIKNAYAKGNWTADEEEKLETAYRMVQQGEKPAGVAIWNFISGYVGSRSDIQCQWKWAENMTYKAQMADTSRVEFRPSEDRILVSKIYELGLDHQREINWHQLRTSNPDAFGKFPPGKLRNRWYQLKKRIRNPDILTLDELCEALMRNLTPLSPSGISSDNISVAR